VIRRETSMTASSLAEAFEQALAMDGPLSERLAVFARSMRELGKPYAEAYDRLVARLVESKAGAYAPKPGESLPPFVLSSDDGDLVGSAEMLERGPLVVSFNRGHWCEFCKLELEALARIHAKVAAMGAEIVAIMPERVPFARKAKSELRLPFRVLTDTDNAYALSLGLMMWVGSEIEDLYVKAGIDLPDFSGNEAWFLPIPATFVVDRDGVIAAQFVDPDFRKRMEMAEVLKALQSLSR
jgi:peroxiredoxin